MKNIMFQSDDVYIPSACQPGREFGNIKACPHYLLLIEADTFAEYGVDKLERFCGHIQCSKSTEMLTKDSRACGNVAMILWFHIYAAEAYINHNDQFGAGLRIWGKVWLDDWREENNGGVGLSDQDIVDRAKSLLTQIGEKCLGTTFKFESRLDQSTVNIRNTVCPYTPPQNQLLER